MKTSALQPGLNIGGPHGGRYSESGQGESQAKTKGKGAVEALPARGIPTRRAAANRWHRCFPVAIIRAMSRRSVPSSAAVVGFDRGEPSVRLDRRRSVRFHPVFLAVLLAWVPAVVHGQETADRRVLIVARDAHDARIAHAREAIAFWNATLAKLGLRSRLSAAEVVVAPALNRVLENYARQISLRAGRLGPDDFPPPPPRELAAVDADIVVLLSRQQLMSFAWPLRKLNRYFVGIRQDFRELADRASFMRNVIAHELGHTMGLTHNNDPTTLMCGGCRLRQETGEQVFRDLTARDRERLLRQHGTR